MCTFSENSSTLKGLYIILYKLQFRALLSHFLTAYYLVTVVDSCFITRSHVFIFYFTFLNTVQSDLAYPVLFYPDPSPSGRKSLVTDLQHMSCIHTVCAFGYPVPASIRIFLWKTDVCGYARSDCTRFKKKGSGRRVHDLLILFGYLLFRPTTVLQRRSSIVAMSVHATSTHTRRPY